MLSPAIVAWINVLVTNVIAIIKKLREQDPNAGLLTDEEIIDIAESSWQQVEARAKEMQK